MALLPLIASAYDADIDGIYYEFSGNKATTTCVSTVYSSDMVIPEFITYSGKTYSVTSIGYVTCLAPVLSGKKNTGSHRSCQYEYKEYFYSSWLCIFVVAL